MTEEYYKIEKCVLSCLLVKPELMKDFEIEDKYFVKYKRLWIFMKMFYEKFGSFDIEVMSSVCTNKSTMVRFVSSVQESNASFVRFDLYVKRLKEMFEEKNEESAKIEKIFELSNKLYCRSMKLEDFTKKINLILK